MEPSTQKLQRLLPHGSVTILARKFGISTPAVSKALKDGKPSSRVVQEALRMAESSGALAAAQTLATLTLAK
jgi:DNA transposition AAA+ family ATPase